MEDLEQVKKRRKQGEEYERSLPPEADDAAIVELSTGLMKEL
jgi:hypothetical protein